MGLLADFAAGALTGANDAYDYSVTRKRQQALDDLERRRAEQQMQVQGNQEARAAEDHTRTIQGQTVNELRMRGQKLMDDHLYDQAAGTVGPLSQALTKMGLPGLSPVLGRPTGSDTYPTQGPTETGDALPPTTIERPRDFTNPQSRGALSAAFNYEPEKPIIAQGGSVMMDKEGKTLATVPYQQNPNVIIPAQLHAATASAHENRADGRLSQTLAAAGQRQDKTLAANAGKVDTKTATVLLGHVHDLATRYGGTVTSSGIRPLGSPGDTGNTIVDGHQTQWGLWNEYQAGRGALAAKPGTSDHGSGNAVDIMVPPAQRAAFESDAASRGLNVLSEVDGQGNHHYHLTAAGALAPLAHQTLTKGRTDADLRAQAKFGVPAPGQYANPEEKAAYNTRIQRNYLTLKKQSGTVAAPAPAPVGGPAPVSPLAAWAKQEMAKAKPGAKPPARPVAQPSAAPGGQ